MAGVFLGRIHYPDGTTEIVPFTEPPKEGETTRLRDHDWVIAEIHHTTSPQDADEAILWDVWVQASEQV